MSKLGKLLRRETFAEVRRSGPMLVVFLTILAGFGLLWIGYKLKTLPDWAFHGAILSDVARALLASGFVAFFFRLFEFAGIMERALERFMVSESLHSLVADFRSFWSMVTARVLLKGASEQTENDMMVEVAKEVSEQLLYEKNYYLRDLHTTLHASLLEDGRTIRLEHDQSYVVARLDERPAEIRVRFQGGEGHKLGDYELGDPKVVVTGGDGSTVAVDARIEAADAASVTRVYRLAGQKEFQVKITKQMEWDLSRDRVHQVVTRAICKNVVLNCICLDGSLRATFVEFGLRNRFVNRLTPQEQAARPGDIYRALDGIMLPHSGYAVVFEPVRDKVGAAAGGKRRKGG